MSAIFPGGFRMTPSPTPGKVWIESPTGEGGDFCAAEFQDVLTAGELTGDLAGFIKRFFDENF